MGLLIANDLNITIGLKTVHRYLFVLYALSKQFCVDLLPLVPTHLVTENAAPPGNGSWTPAEN